MTTISENSIKAQRETIRLYIDAYRNTSLDGRLFSDIEAQRRFFGRKINEGKDAFVASLKAAGEQLCRPEPLHSGAGGYHGYQRLLWQSQCNGMVRLTDIVTGRTTYEDNATFGRRFVKI